MQAQELIHELPKGLLKWYKFNKGGRALYVTCHREQDQALEEALRECGLETDIADLYAVEELVRKKEKEFHDTYDYVVMAGALERSHDPGAVLQSLRTMLNKAGKLLIGAENRLGIRYFCGDRDVFTDRNFDSIENYVRINAADQEHLEGHAYARAEMIQILESTGFEYHRFYAVLPELTRPQVMYAEDYLPEEELEIRVFPQYHYPDTVFLEEERLYTTLIRNGLFHAMANAYLIECPLDGKYANVKQVTVSMERGRANAMFTIIRRDEKVEKRAVYEQGHEKLESLLENNRYLQSHGVNMVNASIEKDAYVMPYVKAQPATDYLRKLLCEDRELFLRELDRLWETIQHSSEHVAYEEIDWEKFEPHWERRKADDPNKDKWKKVAFGTTQEKENLGVILKRGYVDLVSLNCFWLAGDFVFYDQELYVENLPAKVILHRTISLIYWGNTRLEMLLPQKQVRERYHLNEYTDLWNQFAWSFLDKLRNDKMLIGYYEKYRRNSDVINSNRQRMNYSTDEYERIFRDIFRGTEGRRLYLFGSGNFTKKFLSQFGSDYEIEGILDNNPEKWGAELSGIKIYSPEYLRSLSAGTYKVIVCIKNYVPVMKQLKELGVKDYGIYDSNLKYARKMPAVAPRKNDEEQKPKKYHTGYIAGVFDLFHVGHLNMFKRAKEQCDYLIVGVVNDESVMKNKKTMPYIPFKERIELVRACRYVDEAVEIPTDYGNTDEAYRRYQFDVQFSGSDYADDPAWLAKKVFLEKQGADMVFFPYTQSTSSTKIKAMIEKKLL